MKAQFKNSIYKFAPIFLLLMTMFIFGFGCNTSKPTPDALAGFHFSSLNNLDSNKAITSDYQDYIQKLSPKARNSRGPINFLEDGTGQHAIEFETGQNGTSWSHVLVYDKDNKRIRVIKFVSGHYAS